jgi:NAD(P)H-nitrite reductase large subunit
MVQDKDKIICRCEEITEEEIRNAILAGHTTIKAVKRATRAGMGFCQGRTCGPLIRDIISSMTGNAKENIPSDTVRYPVFPLKLEKLAGK